MRFVPKSQELFDALYQWNLDDELRESMGGQILPIDAYNISTYYDVKYDGGVNILSGVSNDSGEIVGCYMIEQNIPHKTANMHFVFSKEGRGKVLRSSASKIIDHCFNELGLYAVYGYIHSSNKRACSFVKEMGWDLVNVLLDYYLTREGRMDCNVYMLTPSRRAF